MTTGENHVPSVSWVRGHWVLIAALSVVIAGLVVLTVIAFGGSGNPPSSSGNPVGSKAASAQAATTVTKGSKWLASSDAKSLITVSADLGRVLSAEHAGDHGAAKTAGARLAADARSALGGTMPPVDAAAYRSALTDLQRAGILVAGGHFVKAAPLLDAGQAGLMRVTSAADEPVAMKTPAIPESNGQ
jgi:hypothetical protein